MAKVNTEFAKCERLSETVSIEVVFTETMYVTRSYFEEISYKLSEQKPFKNPSEIWHLKYGLLAGK